MTAPRCRHHLAGLPGGLICTRDEGHPDAHSYESTSGVAHCQKEEA